MPALLTNHLDGKYVIYRGTIRRVFGSGEEYVMFYNDPRTVARIRDLKLASNLDLLVFNNKGLKRIKK
jgi:hypothetical protein